jgi:hypothetical protein
VPTRNPASEPRLAVLHLRADNQTHHPWHLTRRKPPDSHRPKQVSSFPQSFTPAGLWAKVSKLSANRLTADHLTQDCTQCQHTLRLAGCDAAIAELHCRREGTSSASALQADKPRTDGTTARHGHVALARTRDATLHARARNMGGHTDEPSVMTDADGYTVLQLRDHPGLVCCVVGCATNVHRLWFYHADTCVDRRRVCSICVGKWPDLCCNFGVLQPTYDCAH